MPTQPRAGRSPSASEFIKAIETGRELLTVFLAAEIFPPPRKDSHHQRRDWIAAALFLRSRSCTSL